MKKILFIFLLLFAAFNVDAQQYDFSAVCSTGQTLYYNITSDSTVSVTYPDYSYNDFYYGHSKPSGYLIVPDSVTNEGTSYRVTSIGANAFYYCSSIDTLIIGNKVTSIGHQAFSNCSGIHRLYIGSSVTSIGYQAFSGCSGIHRLEIPNSVTNISAYAFKGCYIDSLYIGSGVTTIGSEAFWGCSGLKYMYYNARNLNIANFMNSIDLDSPFHNTTTNNFRTLVIGDSVRTILYGSFYGRSSIDGIVVITNNVTSIGQKAFYGCSGIDSLYIGSGVTTIGSEAFSGCTELNYMHYNARNLNITNFMNSNLSYSPFYNTATNNFRTLVIGDSIGAIPDSCFYGRSSIDSLHISSGVTSIGDYAFHGCYSFHCLAIPNSLTSIGQEAFYGCSGIDSLYIGSGVQSVGVKTFSGCTGLKYMFYNARNCNALFTTGATSPFYNTNTSLFNTLVIGDSVEYIPSYTFYNRSSINNIQIGANVQNIGDNAFLGCSGFHQLIIPDGVISIGDNSFYGCSGIDSLHIGNGITTIGSSAFQGCSGINQLVIPENITSIGNSAFYGCSGFSQLIIPDGVTNIGDNAFYGCSGVDSLHIGNGITTIGNGAFQNCINIQRLVIPEGITSIGNSAFQGCSSFSKLAIPASVTSIGSNAFYGCTGIDSLYIGSGVQTMGSGAFRGCTGLQWLNYNAPNLPTQGFYGCTQLATLILGNTVQSIGDNAFYDCDNLLTATVNASQIGNNAFANCDRLVSVTLGNSAETLGNSVFNGCFRLQNINLGGITYIGNSAFNGCVRLENPELPATLTYIGTHAFDGCSLLAGKLTFPATITNIGDYAYNGVGTITEIEMLGATPPTIYSNTFASVSNSTPVSVPCGAVMSYYTTNYWENFSTIVEAPPYRLVVESNNETMGSAAVTQQPTCSNYSAIIQASAEDGFHFLQWNDGNGTNPRTIQMTQDSTFTAIFVPNNSYIVIEPNDPTMGTTSGTGTYGYNAPVTMTATAYSGYHFLKWNDGNTQNPRYMAAVCDTTFTAIFVSNVSTITVMNANPEWGNVGGSGVYYYQNLVSLTATPNYGYHFSQWNDGNTQNPRTIVINQDSTFTAYFAVNTYSIVASSNSTTMGSVSGGGTYTYLHEMSLTATPAYGYHFVQWNDQNTDNPRTITVTRDSVFTAQFAANSYTITAEPNDPTMGSAYGSGTYNYNTTVTLTAVETYGYHFTQWSDGVTDNPRTITVQNNATYTAQFEINSYIITVQSSDPAIGTVSGGGSFYYLTPVYITANPNPGYHFTQWSDGNTDNPRLISVTQNATYTAQFAINSYEVVVNANDSSMGNVSGSGTYYHNMSATIMATPNYGYHFVMWSDGSLLNPRTITVTNDIAITAMFAPTQYSFLCTSNSNTMGTVSLSGGNYDYQTTLSVEAIPNYGYHFVSWNDGGTVNPRSIVITQDTVLQAIFAINQYTLTVDVNEASMGSVSGMGSYDYLSQVTIGATAAAHHHFVQWSDGNTTNPRLVILTRDTSFTAIFEQEPQFQITVNTNDATRGSVEGSGMYYLGETTTITATANEHYYFAQWSDGMTSNPRVISVMGDMAYTAVFEPVMYTLTVSANDYSMGQVTGGGSYAYGTEVTIEARAFGGYRFLGWNDGVMDEHRTVTVTENASYTAMFEQNTGIEDVEATSYKVYVSNGHIAVEGVEDKRVQVYDLTGRKHSLCEQLPTGVYLVRIDNVITKKVVVL